MSVPEDSPDRRLRECLVHFAARLAGRVEEPVREAEWIVAEGLGLSVSALRRGTGLDRLVTERDRLHSLVERRAAGEPLAHVLGEQDFRGLALSVDRRVLVPRPETELLVEEALRTESEGTWLDLGTGSGAIAIALAHARPSWRVLAVDLSADALAVAASNVARHALRDRVQLLRADGPSALAEKARFAGVVSNPPYVEEAEYWRLSPEVRDHEPRMALVPRCGSSDELRERWFPACARRLREGGSMLVEVGAGQAGRAKLQMAAAGLRDLRIVADCAGIGRVVIGRRPAG